MHNIIAKRAQNPFKYLSTQSLFKYEGPRDFFFFQMLQLYSRAQNSRSSSKKPMILFIEH